jgi:hypothetical protein
MDNICKNCKHWEGKNKAKFGKCNSKELWKMLGLTNVKSRADTSCKHFTAKEQCPNCQHYKNGKCNNEDSMQYNMEVDEKDYCVNFTAKDGAC